MEDTGFWARAHVLAVFRGCSMLPAGEKILLLTLASLTLTSLRHQHLALALGPGTSCWV